MGKHYVVEMNTAGKNLVLVTLDPGFKLECLEQSLGAFLNTDSYVPPRIQIQ